MAGRYRRARIGKQVVVSGLPVPFTFWPKAYITRGRVVTTDPWSCFMSHIRVNVKKANKLNRALAFLEQAQDFFYAAKTQRMGSKSLLYYYSFMNLVKIFLTVRTNLDLKRCVHGLKEPADNISKRLMITSQVVKIDDVGRGRTQLYREFMRECGFPLSVKPKPTKLVDLLEQIVGIHGITSHTLRRRKQYFAIKKISFEHDPTAKEVWISFYVDRAEIGTSSREIRKHMTSFNEVESPERKYRRYESQPLKYRKSPIQILRRLVRDNWKDIWSELRPGRYQWWISSVHKNKRRAQLASGYQSMFFFGSVARYRPDDFYKIAEGKYGWLVQEFINTQPLQFIYFLGSDIIDAEMVVPELA